MNSLLKERLHFLSVAQQQYNAYIQSVHRHTEPAYVNHAKRKAKAHYHSMCFWATAVSRQGTDIMVMNNNMSCRSVLRDIRNIVPDAFPSLRQFTEQEEYEADVELEKSLTSEAS